MNVSGLKFSIRYDNKAQDLLVSVDIEAKDLNVQVVDAQMFSEMTQNIILSAILTFSLFVELYAILRILNNVVYGIDSAEKYSLMTFMLLSMWDCTITSLSFSLSFDNEVRNGFISALLCGVLAADIPGVYIVHSIRIPHGGPNLQLIIVTLKLPKLQIQHGRLRLTNPHVHHNNLHKPIEPVYPRPPLPPPPPALQKRLPRPANHLRHQLRPALRPPFPHPPLPTRRLRQHPQPVTLLQSLPPAHLRSPPDDRPAVPSGQVWLQNPLPEVYAAQEVRVFRGGGAGQCA